MAAMEPGLLARAGQAGAGSVLVAIGHGAFLIGGTYNNWVSLF
jgi:hypothetical protein